MHMNQLANQKAKHTTQ